MKTKIFPKKAPRYNAADDIARYQEQLNSLDYRPWGARILAALAAALLWGIVFVLIFGFGIPHNDDPGDLFACFVIGAGLPLVFSVPFLWK